MLEAYALIRTHCNEEDDYVYDDNDGDDNDGGINPLWLVTYGEISGINGRHRT